MQISKDLKEWDTALISKRMPERKRIVRFEIVFSCLPFLLRLSQIVEPEPEPHPRPPRIRLKIYYGFRTFYSPAVSPANPDFLSVFSADDRAASCQKCRRDHYCRQCADRRCVSGLYCSFWRIFFRLFIIISRLFWLLLYKL